MLFFKRKGTQMEGISGENSVQEVPKLITCNAVANSKIHSSNEAKGKVRTQLQTPW